MRTLQPTKKLFGIIFIIALSLAALFFRSQSKKSETKILKPSQLDFSQQNALPAAPIVAAAPTPPAVVSGISAPSTPESSAFEEILKSKNDNDPRLDTLLKHPPAEMKSALYQRYEKLSAEDRNGRGLIVFLISRDMNSAADLEFLQKVYQEPPCLSLGDCKNTGSDDPHFSGINQTTLVYPQLAGLFQIDQQLTARPQLLQNPEFKSHIQFLLRQAENFPVPAVSDKAAEIRKKYSL